MVIYTKFISSEINDDKERIIKVLRLGKDDVQTTSESMPFGVDSNPVKDLIAVYAKSSANGENVIIGYLNQNQKAKEGEIRIFSTDNDGVEKTYLYLKNNGTIEIAGDADNMVRFSKLKEGFDQLKSDFNNFVTAFNSHQHPETGATTAPPTSPGSSSNASIDDSKIDEIKTL